MKAVQRVGYVEVYGDVGVGMCGGQRKRGVMETWWGCGMGLEGCGGFGGFHRGWED